MNVLPLEMYIEILKYTSIQDVINTLKVSKFINNIICDNMSDIIYEMNSPFKPTIDNYYLKYQRGKSYGYDKNVKDEIFELNSYDHVIYHHKFCNYDNDTEIIITLNSNMLYAVYSFCNEVGRYECTPDVYGFDEDDHDIAVLHKKKEYEDVKDIDIENELIQCYNNSKSNQKIKNAVHNKLLNYPFIKYETQRLYDY